MIRNLKILGLALVAVFALAAVLASAASAQVGTLTSTGPVTLIGVNTGPATENQWAAFGATTQCPNAVYTGHKYNVTPHTFIPNDVSTFTVTPHYGVCTDKIGASSFPMTIDMNGCDFVVHLEGTTPGVDTYTVKTTIEGCPVGKHITITIFASAAKHTSNEPFCHMTVTENAAGYLGLHATDTTTGRIDIAGTATGMTMDKESPTGSILCPKETTNTGTLALGITVEGRNEVGSTTTIALSHL
jgi:hypothetical protein